MHSYDLKTRYKTWRDNILSNKNKYNKTVIDQIFMRPEILHFTILKLTLEDESRVEQARQMMKSIEPQVKDMIAKRGKNGKLTLSFDGLDMFGTPENTRVIFMKLMENGDQFQLLQDINHLIIKSALEQNLIE